MKEIPVSKKNASLVDDEDYAYLTKNKWYISNGYAINEHREKMHRLIIKPLPDQLIDHRDHNKLNNQRYNLRIANRFQNIHNQYKRLNTYNNYKGTAFVKRLGLWQARCRMLEGDYFLGHFKTEIAAAYAYNKKALELSDFAFFNRLDFSEDELENMLINDRVKIKPAEFKSGIDGIAWHKGKRKWQVVIKRKYIGSYEDLTEAKQILEMFHVKHS